MKARPCAFVDCAHLPVEHWEEGNLSSGSGPCHVRYANDSGVCSCPGYLQFRSPEPGERIVFGVHRLPVEERDFGLPSEAERDAAFRKWAQGAIRDLAQSDS
jgi:hypothetical protein